MTAFWRKNNKNNGTQVVDFVGAKPGRVSNRLESKIVASDMVSKRTAIKKTYTAKKHIIIPVAAVIVIGLLGAIVYVISRPAKKQVVIESAVCSGNQEILRTATMYMSGTKTTKLDKLSGQIQGTSGYERDQNCLFIVTKSFLNRGDVENARKYFDLYNAIYSEPNESIATQGGEYKFSKSILKDQMDRLDFSINLQKQRDAMLSHPYNGNNEDLTGKIKQ